MRGEQKRPLHTAATVIDSKGTVKYFILPSKLAVLAIASMALLVVIAVILGFLIVRNKIEIDSLKQKVTVEEGTTK